MDLIDTIGFWGAVALPLFDISLIMHVIKRRSSADISMVWAWGLWLCSVLMAPSAFVSGDKVALGFNIVNVVMLTAVLIVVVKYHQPQGSKNAAR